MTDIFHFERALKGYIARHGYSQAEVARRIRVSPATLNKWVRGVNKVPIDALVNICETLELHEEERKELFRGIGYPTLTVGEEKPSRRQYIENLIKNHHYRLQRLIEQKALRGLDTPPEVLIEIEDLEASIAELQTEFKALEKDSFDKETSRDSRKLGDQIQSSRQKDIIENLLTIKKRRLQKLEETLALRGQGTPPQILKEIEELKAAIAELQTELDDIQSKQRVEVYLWGDFSSLSSDRMSAAIDAFAAVMGISSEAIEICTISKG
jgi:transcriptional regulator with XRE-family HTH domain